MNAKALYCSLFQPKKPDDSGDRSIINYQVAHHQNRIRYFVFLNTSVKISPKQKKPLTFLA